MKKFSLIFLNTLLLFFIINLVISFTWPTYSKFKSKKHQYIDEQVKVLNLSEENLDIFYNEMSENYHKFAYVPFIGHTETKRVGKFVNFDQLNGRKVIRPQNCNYNVYLYGGSTMFGYESIDKETIAQHLQNILGNNYCIFNHGRAYFYSKQENNLFTLHIENNHKIDFAIFLDGINERCGGYEYDKHIHRSFSILVEKPYKMWRKTSMDLLYTLPVIQFYNSLQIKYFGKSRWRNNNDNKILSIESCKNNIPINALFQKRVNLRHGLCSEENITCFSFLQPFGGVHGVQSDKIITNERKIRMLKLYNKLKKTKKHVIDIGDVLMEDTTLSYVDGAHYTSRSNRKIAEKISLFFN
tara:strand:+ start:389 stop:1453 length:1065 start_codon:yes stop_codon:yes gene_type:complete